MFCGSFFIDQTKHVEIRYHESKDDHHVGIFEGLFLGSYLRIRLSGSLMSMQALTFLFSITDTSGDNRESSQDSVFTVTVSCLTFTFRHSITSEEILFGRSHLATTCWSLHWVAVSYRFSVLIYWAFLMVGWQGEGISSILFSADIIGTSDHRTTHVR